MAQAPIISWDAAEYTHTHKPQDWYWAVGIIGATIVILCIVLGEVLFGVFMLIATIALAVQASHPPRILHYEVNDRGIVVGENFYPYINLDAFWISHEHGDPRVIVKSGKFFMPYIHMSINPGDEAVVRDVLLDYLIERELEEPFGHVLLERLGF